MPQRNLPRYTSWRKLPVQKAFDADDSSDLRTELRLCAELDALLGASTCPFSASPKCERLGELCAAADFDNTNWVKQRDLHEQICKVGVARADASRLILLITRSVEHSERDEEEHAASGGGECSFLPLHSTRILLTI